MLNSLESIIAVPTVTLNTRFPSNCPPDSVPTPIPRPKSLIPDPLNPRALNSPYHSTTKLRFQLHCRPKISYFRPSKPSCLHISPSLDRQDRFALAKIIPFPPEYRFLTVDFPAQSLKTYHLPRSIASKWSLSQIVSSPTCFFSWEYR